MVYIINAVNKSTGIDYIYHILKDKNILVACFLKKMYRIVVKDAICTYC